LKDLTRSIITIAIKIAAIKIAAIASINISTKLLAALLALELHTPLLFQRPTDFGSLKNQPSTDPTSSNLPSYKGLI